jgi:carboxymethylenebutenolidase
MDRTYSEAELSMVKLLEKHVQAELQGDLHTTMATMSGDPHLFNVPNMMGGNGYDGVRRFYENHLVGKFFPPDVTMNRVSLTVGTNQIVEELVIQFTHTTAIDWLLPEIAPTGRKVEIGVVVIAGVKDKKITHEHIYWDQASVLVQVGLLDPKDLPVCGSESARKLLDPSLPNRALTKRS